MNQLYLITFLSATLGSLLVSWFLYVRADNCKQTKDDPSDDPSGLDTFPPQIPSPSPRLDHFIAKQKPKRRRRKRHSVPKPISIQITLRRKTNKCGVCLARLTPGYVACKTCYTVSHRSCIEEMMNGCCPGIGCKKKLIEV